jgi:hypothetical protein
MWPDPHRTVGVNHRRLVEYQRTCCGRSLRLGPAQTLSRLLRESSA